MNHEPSPADLERAVEALRGAARSIAERELADVAPRPDFADIVARAHRIDPAAVPHGWIDAARRGVAPRPTIARRRPHGRAAAYALGLAAALLLALGLHQGLTPRQAPLAAPGSLAGLQVEPGAPRPAALTPPPAPEPVPQIMSQESCPTGQDCTLGPRSTCPEGQDCTAARPGRARPRGPRAGAAEGLAARLRRLDDEAEALLRAGDLAGADDRYVEIVAIGGARPEVEHALVDRLGLARTRRDAAAQRRLWQLYLERFPRGGFADDARAGLCRGAAGSASAACWSRYLAEFPAGVHRREAEGNVEAAP